MKKKPKVKIESPVKRFWRTCKRVVLWTSALLFVGVLWAVYSELAPAGDTLAGRAASQSLVFAASPFLGSLPWWFWGGVVSVGVYLWIKHKWIMSAAYGAVVALVLAFS